VTLTQKVDVFFTIEIHDRTRPYSSVHNWDFKILLGDVDLYYSDLYYDSIADAQAVAERLLAKAITGHAKLDHESERELFDACTYRYL